MEPLFSDWNFGFDAPMPSKRDSARTFVGAAFNTELHEKQVLSIANATGAALTTARFGVAAIGRAYALANGTDPKHGIKQVDRLLSNAAVDPQALASKWVPFVIGPRKEIVVAMDWTDFDADDQTTLAIHLVTRNGRTTPLLWKTVKKSELAGQRNRTEDEVLKRLREVVPEDVQTTVLADRGFGDSELYGYLRGLGFDFVIRFRNSIKVMAVSGEQRRASEWLLPTGKARLLRHVRVTNAEEEVPSFVAVHDKKMKEPWFLASSLERSASILVGLYANRFSIEETFRDLKDDRFGRGLKELRIAAPARRDRMLLIAALAHHLLSLLGEASERAGLDSRLRANTSKSRTHSLFFQGSYWFAALPKLKPARAELLLGAFEEVLREHDLMRFLADTAVLDG